MSGAAAGHAPLRGADGRSVAWAAGAWPLPLAEGGAAWAHAAMAWTASAPVGFRPVGRHDAGSDGVVSLALVDDAALWDELVGDPALVAFTLGSTDEAGALVDADVLVNTARFRLEDAPGGRGYVREALFRHELGHAMGLGHPCGVAPSPSCEDLPDGDPRREALMHPTVAPGAPPRPPNEDDLAGVAAHLPALPVRRLEAPRLTQREPTRAVFEVEGARSGDTLVARDPDGESVPVTATFSRGSVVVEGDLARVTAVELWSAEGQGVSMALSSVDAGAGLPADAGDATEDAPRSPEDGGCRAAPGPVDGAWPALVLLMLQRRKRCGG